MTNCTNDDVKLLAACERLTGVQIMSPRINDESVEHFKVLPKLASVTITTSGITETGLAALKSARPSLRVNDLSRNRSVQPARPTAAVTGTPADDVEVKFIDRGITAKMGGYSPLRAEMTETADSVKKAPPELEAAKYGTLKVGAESWPFILDEPDGKPAQLYVDTNGDGDFTNDPAAIWSSRKVGQYSQYSGTARVTLASGKTAAVNLYRFDPSDAGRAQFKNTMMFYPDYGYELTLTLDGQKFTTDVAAEPGAMPLWIDRDDNQQRSTRHEMIRLGNPFNFTGTTYVLTRSGSDFKLVKSDRSLPQEPMPVDLSVGKQAIPFTMTSLEGKLIDFPKGYAGKLVMLDFWATWC
jgi:hypothetical protein